MLVTSFLSMLYYLVGIRHAPIVPLMQKTVSILVSKKVKIILYLCLILALYSSGS